MSINLPKFIWIEISKYVNHDDILELSLTCKTMYKWLNFVLIPLSNMYKKQYKPVPTFHNFCKWIANYPELYKTNLLDYIINIDDLKAFKLLNFKVCLRRFKKFPNNKKIIKYVLSKLTLEQIVPEFISYGLHNRTILNYVVEKTDIPEINGLCYGIEFKQNYSDIFEKVLTREMPEINIHNIFPNCDPINCISFLCSFKHKNEMRMFFDRNFYKLIEKGYNETFMILCDMSHYDEIRTKMMLTYCCNYNNLELYKLLLSNRIKKHEFIYYQRYIKTDFIAAVKYCSTEMVEYILSKFGEQVAEEISNAKTIILSSKMENLKMLKLLNIESDDFKQCYSGNIGNLDIYKYLNEKKCNISARKVAESLCYSGKIEAAIHVIKTNNLKLDQNFLVPAITSDSVKMVKYVISKLGDSVVIDNYHLMLAAELCGVDMFKLLIKYSSNDLNIGDCMIAKNRGNLGLNKYMTYLD